MKGFRETIQNEAKQQKGVFLSMLLDALDTTLSGNVLVGKRMNSDGKGFLRAG